MSDWNSNRTSYHPHDPRTRVFGTPRLESMLRLAISTPKEGCFVEFGVYQGGSARRLAELAVRQSRSCHLFDTFNGIPESGPFDVIEVGEMSDVNLEALKLAIPSAEFHVGVFPHTMPNDLGPIGFAHIDCDQYLSCLAAIDKFVPLLVKDGVILFDDYNVTPGVRKAVDEGFKQESLQFTKEGKAYFRRV